MEVYKRIFKEEIDIDSILSVDQIREEKLQDKIDKIVSSNDKLFHGKWKYVFENRHHLYIYKNKFKVSFILEVEYLTERKMRGTLQLPEKKKFRLGYGLKIEDKTEDFMRFDTPYRTVVGESNVSKANEILKKIEDKFKHKFGIENLKFTT